MHLTTLYLTVDNVSPCVCIRWWLLTIVHSRSAGTHWISRSTPWPLRPATVSSHARKTPEEEWANRNTWMAWGKNCHSHRKVAYSVTLLNKINDIIYHLCVMTKMTSDACLRLHYQTHAGPAQGDIWLHTFVLDTKLCNIYLIKWSTVVFPQAGDILYYLLCISRQIWQLRPKK